MAIEHKIFSKLISINKPILVFANYRTGSTVLGNYIARTKNILNFPELFNINSTNLLEKAQNTTTNFMCSIMPDHLDQFQHSFLDNDNNYKIKLTRNDKIAQITSLYIAGQLHKYHCCIDDNIPPYYLSIDNNIIDMQINIINDGDRLSELFPIKYDITIDYSEIELYLHANTYRLCKFVRPINWEEIYAEVSNRYYNNY